MPNTTLGLLHLHPYPDHPLSHACTASCLHLSPSPPADHLHRPTDRPTDRPRTDRPTGTNQTTPNPPTPQPHLTSPDPLITVALALGAFANGQQPGSQQTETHPSLMLETCDESG